MGRKNGVYFWGLVKRILFKFHQKSNSTLEVPLFLRVFAEINFGKVPLVKRFLENKPNNCKINASAFLNLRAELILKSSSKIRKPR